MIDEARLAALDNIQEGEWVTPEQQSALAYLNSVAPIEAGSLVTVESIRRVLAWVREDPVWTDI